MRMPIAFKPLLVDALHAIRAAGGRPLIVGGAVRDAVMGNPDGKHIQFFPSEKREYEIVGGVRLELVEEIVDATSRPA